MWGCFNEPGVCCVVTGPFCFMEKIHAAHGKPVLWERCSVVKNRQRERKKNKGRHCCKFL